MCPRLEFIPGSEIIIPEIIEIFLNNNKKTRAIYLLEKHAGFELSARAQ